MKKNMISSEELINQLNESQRIAVEYNDGPMLVIAGAGSGKTRMLTYKIAYLIQQGVKAWNILALTFTNKAANEMKERIAQLVGAEQARDINMGTFHSIFARILRREAPAIGYSSQFTIYDETDSHNLIRAIVKEMGLDDKVYKPSAVHKRISLAKNNMINHVQYANDRDIFERDRQARMPSIGKIYATYEQRCRVANAIDFDDLLLFTHRLFNENEDIRAKWEQRFQHILVDEYQDTNKVQQVILEQLTRARQHICVVGDDAQSIYAFRGANIDNILSFSQVYPSAKLFKLERNYRSTQTIVQAANSLISHNQRQISKDVYSENESGEKLILKQAYSDSEEAVIVCNEIERIRREEGSEYADFAVLYRTNAQSRSFEETFRKNNIPYRIYGGLSFYQRREIKDILAYIRLVVNTDDEEAFRRIINYPARGIGSTTIGKITAAAQQYGVSHWAVCSEMDKYRLDVSTGAKGKIRDFVALITAFRERLATDDAYVLGHDIIAKSGIYADIFSSTDADAEARMENINEFDNALNNFVEERKEEDNYAEATLYHFLQEVSLQSDRESDDDERSKVSLMTVHAAKGLEFSTVFIVGLEENIFPSVRSSESLREIEEERRLLYVAITRAKKHCLLSCAKNRWRYGKMEFFVPSRFIGEIDSKYLHIEETEETTSAQSSFNNKRWRRGFSPRIQNSRPVATQFVADVEYKITSPPQKEKPVDPFSPAFHKKLDEAHKAKRPKEQSHNNLRVGSIIEHQRFGRGTVGALMGSGAETKAVVEFVNVGRKLLLLKFAKYSIVKE